MRIFHAFFMALALLPAPLHEAVVPNFGRTATIDVLLDRAVSSRLIAGGVVVVGNRDGILYTSARGRLDSRPDAPPLDEQTMFDIASLTKVIATAPSVMKLADEGKLSLSDPLTRWFPEFRRSRWGTITILDLLTHTSGLADFDLRKGESIRTAVKKAAGEKHCQPAGSSFNYADINFILLAEIVHRASGKTLDRYSRDEIFEPLAARQTMFLPPHNLACAIAPTLGFSVGVVGDPNARRLGGVAGHSGLFSSPADLARFARLMLGEGVIDGRRVISEKVVKEMTTPRSFCGGSVVRGLGWDMETRFSAPKGSFFSKSSYGHTGYSGSSIWIDPERNLFVIMLTNRVNYHDTTVFNRLRSDVSTIAAAELGSSAEGVPAVAEVAMITADLDRYEGSPPPPVVKKTKPKKVVKVALSRVSKVKAKKAKKVKRTA